MQSLVGFICAVLSLLVGCAVLFYIRPKAYRTSGKAERARQDVAKKMGFSCHTSSSANKDLLKTLLSFSLFSHSDDAQITFSMRRHAPDEDIIACDCRSTAGLAHWKKVRRETVLILRSDRLALPPFSLYTSTAPRRLLDLVLSRRIAVAGHPVFSKEYLLHGSDENAIMKLFCTPVLRLLEDMKPANLEGRGDMLIMYRISEVIRSACLDAFIQEGRRLLDMFAPM